MSTPRPPRTERDVRTDLAAAYRMAAASLLAPFSYVQMISATAVSYMVWNIIPGLTTTIGASLIVASGLYSLHRERLRARQRLEGLDL